METRAVVDTKFHRAHKVRVKLQIQYRKLRHQRIIQRRSPRAEFDFYSDSSTAASMRRSKKPRAIPTRTNPLIMGTIRKISDATLQVEAAAPPLEVLLATAEH